MPELKRFQIILQEILFKTRNYNFIKEGNTIETFYKFILNIISVTRKLKVYSNIFMQFLLEQTPWRCEVL
jgi:hypothetical protein